MSVVGFIHRHRGLTPYLLLAPGLAWLALFFVVPLGFLAYQSLESGTRSTSATAFTWAWQQLLGRDLDLPRASSSARSSTRRSRPRSRCVVSYPLAYWIAFRGGRWKNVLLLLRSSRRSSSRT